MNSPLLHALRLVLGWALGLFGILGTGIGILSTLDPVGVKLADDNDPFGTPPTFLENFTFTIVFVAICAIGLWLVFSPRWRKKPLA